MEQQLEGSDHKPVLLVIKQDRRQAVRKLCPSWNYKRANWSEFHKKADENSRNQKMGQHHLNGKVKLFTGAILSAAKETIPRGRRRDYIPGWNAQLQELHSTASRLRQKMESCPTDENIAAYNKAKAEFTRQKLQQTCAAWHEKTSSLNMEKDTVKWKLTKVLNGEIPGKNTDGSTVRGRAYCPKGSSQLPGKNVPRREQCQATEGKNLSSQRAANTAAEAAHVRQSST